MRDEIVVFPFDCVLSLFACNFKAQCFFQLDQSHAVHFYIIRRSGVQIDGTQKIGAAVGGTAGNLIGKHMDKVKAEAEQVKNAQVETVTDANGLSAVKVTFASGILFPTNGSTLSSSAKTDLAQFAGVLKNNTDCEVSIQGYTDATGNDGINLPLSQKRAEAVYNYLASCGVTSRQVKNVQGFGSANPVVNTTAACAQNRRVEVYMYASQAMVNAANNGTLK